MIDLDAIEKGLRSGVRPWSHDVAAMCAEIRELRRERERLAIFEAKIVALRAELVRWLEALADTPPEALWELREPRMRQVSIQVDKTTYEAARKRLEELR